MHSNVQNSDEEDEKSVKEHNKRKASDEIFDVVESLLTEVVNKSDKEITTKEIV